MIWSVSCINKTNVPKASSQIINVLVVSKYLEEVQNVVKTVSNRHQDHLKYEQLTVTKFLVKRVYKKVHLIFSI